jgi:4-amino-4-deoxy-L-arabinose transferase-like glycosyltransferase
VQEVASERKKTRLLLACVLLANLPFIFLGYGADSDAHSVGRAASDLIFEHFYTPSRNPGYFLHESMSALVVPFGGSIATNASSVAMALLAVFCFLHICRHFDIPNRHWLAIMLAFQPLFFVNSNSTIDYVWAIALVLAGACLLIEKRFWLCGVVLGLAVGARLSSIFFVGSIVLGYLVSVGRPGLKRLVVVLGTAGVIAVLLYVPPFVHKGYSMAFFTYSIGDWSWVSHLGRFVYKSLYFVGLQTVVALMLIAPIAFKHRKNLLEYDRGLVVACGTSILAFVALFLKLPIENEYLLPLLPGALILLGMLLRERKNALIALVCVQLSYGLITFNLARPDKPNQAQDVSMGFWVERGYVLEDMRKRNVIEARIKAAAGDADTH